MEITCIYIGYGQTARSWCDAPCLLSCSILLVTQSFSRSHRGLFPFCQHSCSFPTLPSSTFVNVSLQFLWFSPFLLIPWFCLPLWQRNEETLTKCFPWPSSTLRFLFKCWAPERSQLFLPLCPPCTSRISSVKMPHAFLLKLPLTFQGNSCPLCNSQ